MIKPVLNVVIQKKTRKTPYGNFSLRETPKGLDEQSRISETDKDSVRSRSMENYSKHESLQSNNDHLFFFFFFFFCNMLINYFNKITKTLFKTRKQKKKKIN